MPTPEWLAEQFEEHRPHLRAVAYRMLGSASEAEDAVQESWIRLGRTDISGVENLRAWLTTVVARVSLDMLRTRASRSNDRNRACLGWARGKPAARISSLPPVLSHHRCFVRHYHDGRRRRNVTDAHT